MLLRALAPAALVAHLVMTALTIAGLVLAWRVLAEESMIERGESGKKIR